eukprot:Opistho-1_new@49355
MPLQQRPFGLLGLQHIRGQCHFSARDVRAEPLAQPAERKVAHGGQRRKIQLATEVNLALLGRPEAYVHLVREHGVPLMHRRIRRQCHRGLRGVFHRGRRLLCRLRVRRTRSNVIIPFVLFLRRLPLSLRLRIGRLCAFVSLCRTLRRFLRLRSRRFRCRLLALSVGLGTGQFQLLQTRSQHGAELGRARHIDLPLSQAVQEILVHDVECLGFALLGSRPLCLVNDCVVAGVRVRAGKAALQTVGALARLLKVRADISEIGGLLGQVVGQVMAIATLVAKVALVAPEHAIAKALRLSLLQLVAVGNLHAGTLGRRLASRAFRLSLVRQRLKKLCLDRSVSRTHGSHTLRRFRRRFILFNVHRLGIARQFSSLRRAAGAVGARFLRHGYGPMYSALI